MVGETLGPDPAERALRIFTAGGIALRTRAGAVIGERAFAGRQARRLFVRLVAIHEPVASADLADDLWGTAWPPAWQVALRALVSKLRAILERAGAPGAIWSRDSTYGLSLPADAWLDLDAAGAMVHRAEAALRAGDLVNAPAWALPARAIATRSLLPGEEGEWLAALRQGLVEVRLRAVTCLAEAWMARGDTALAIRDAAEAVDIDPYRESGHRLLIRAHLAAGDRGGAARAFEACRRLLADELGVEPSPETLDLIERALTPRARPS